MRCDCARIARRLVCYKQPRFDKLVLLSRVEPPDATPSRADLPRAFLRHGDGRGRPTPQVGGDWVRTGRCHCRQSRFRRTDGLAGFFSAELRAAFDRVKLRLAELDDTVGLDSISIMTSPKVAESFFRLVEKVVASELASSDVFNKFSGVDAVSALCLGLGSSAADGSHSDWTGSSSAMCGVTWTSSSLADIHPESSASDCESDEADEAAPPAELV